jgi:hypothetical protein
MTARSVPADLTRATEAWYGGHASLVDVFAAIEQADTTLRNLDAMLRGGIAARQGEPERVALLGASGLVTWAKRLVLVLTDLMPDEELPVLLRPQHYRSIELQIRVIDEILDSVVLPLRAAGADGLLDREITRDSAVEDTARSILVRAYQGGIS